MNISKLLTVILFCLLAISCHKLKEGTVIEKWYEPPSVRTILIPIVISNGKSTTTILTPYVVTDNEDWCIKIKGEYKGKQITETYYVTQKEYECLLPGSFFKANKDCSTSDNNNLKVRK